jgi:hypothetical protein
VPRHIRLDLGSAHSPGGCHMGVYATSPARGETKRSRSLVRSDASVRKSL